MMIDFNGMLTSLGVFYTQKLGIHINCTFYINCVFIF